MKKDFAVIIVELKNYMFNGLTNFWQLIVINIIIVVHCYT